MVATVAMAVALSGCGTISGKLNKLSKVGVSQENSTPEGKTYS